MSNKTYKEILPHIDNFLFDVDGVFTDNRVLLLPDQPPVRGFHSRDAYAVRLAMMEGLRIVIVSGGHSEGVRQAFERLGVQDVFLSTSNKVTLFDQLVQAGLDPQRTAYMGDDIPDLRVMQRVALPCCPSDAAEDIKAISRYVSRYAGGTGCVRDVLEQAMKVQGKWLTENAHTW